MTSADPAFQKQKRGWGGGRRKKSYLLITLVTRFYMIYRYAAEMLNDQNLMESCYLFIQTTLWCCNQSPSLQKPSHKEAKSKRDINLTMHINKDQGKLLC